MSEPIEGIKKKRRDLVKRDLESIVERLNYYLKGKGLKKIKPILKRIGRNKELPHWFEQLEKKGVLPNLDGKTVGSVVEMLFVGDVEAEVLTQNFKTHLRINPASGVDLPDLDLGIKSPSENWCTSEPFSNAYERLLGLDYDVVALITNYQTVKDRPPLKLQLIHHKYFEGYQIADKGLCKKAINVRASIESIGETPAKKVVRFLAYANQSDWLCKRLLDLIGKIGDKKSQTVYIDTSISDFRKKQRITKREMPEEYLDKIVSLKKESSIDKSLVTLADDWIVENWRDAAQYPNAGQLARFQTAPLDGQLGVSFALQWRYNFGVYFKNTEE